MEKKLTPILITAGITLVVIAMVEANTFGLGKVKDLFKTKAA